MLLRWPMAIKKIAALSSEERPCNGTSGTTIFFFGIFDRDELLDRLEVCLKRRSNDILRRMNGTGNPAKFSADTQYSQRPEVPPREIPVLHFRDGMEQR